MLPAMDLANYKDAFLEDAKQHLAIVEAAAKTLQENPADEEQIFEFRRACHSLKSSAGAMGFNELSKFCFAMEDMITPFSIDKKPLEIEQLAQVVNAATTIADHLKTIKKA